MFSEEPFNDTSYNDTDPYGGESFPVNVLSHTQQLTDQQANLLAR